MDKLSNEYQTGPIYEVEEEDEEVITLDFEEKMAYQLESHLLIEDTETSSTETERQTRNIKIREVASETPPTFQQEMNDFLLNVITSKAISSLIAKHRTLNNEFDLILDSKRMGELKDLLDEDINRVMEKRRNELKACYVGDKVRYEAIPVWARGYIKDYIREMFGNLSLLLENN